MQGRKFGKGIFVDHGTTCCEAVECSGVKRVATFAKRPGASIPTIEKHDGNLPLSKSLFHVPQWFRTLSALKSSNVSGHSAAVLSLSAC